MNIEITGGPAFPTIGYDNGAAMNGIGVSVTEDEGMSLRDYFAAKAMPIAFAKIKHNIELDHDAVLGMVAEDSYFIADAMIRARETK